MSRRQKLPNRSPSWIANHRQGRVSTTEVAVVEEEAEVAEADEVVAADEERVEVEVELRLLI